MGNDPSTTSPTASSVTISAGAGSGPNCAQSNNCFNPSTMTVTAGTTVTWHNGDKVSHTVTSGNPSDNQTGTIFDSSLISPGKSFNFTFKDPGTYNYFCQVHPWMTGKVIVTSAVANSSPTNSGSMSGMQSSPTNSGSMSGIPLSNVSPNVVITSGAATLTSCAETSTCFNPSMLYITPGTTVTWKNNDIVSHDVIYGSPGSDSTTALFNSNTLSPGQTFTYQFAHSGIYPYYDKTYPWEIGFVYVKSS